ncbi:MAG: Hsp33 family molecular chaperone HslO [Peptococcaceae bacterium]|nr:Hsp33 family molecular chaperone HslO [Peptococcaceae bacterium]
MQQDEMWTGTLCGGEARWVAARTTLTVEEASRRHQASPVAAAAIGRLMTGALLLAATFKSEGEITLRLLGDGPLQGVLAVANRQGTVRGYAKDPQAAVPLKRPGKLDVAAAVGLGELAVSRELDNGEYYTGTAPLVSGEIAEDIAEYLLRSEQIPSAVLLGVKIEKDHHIAAAGGLLLQLLPEASESTVQALEERASELQAGISQLAAEEKDMDGYVARLLGDHPFTVNERRRVAFACSCSQSKLADILIRLGEKEIAALIAQGKAEIVCHFCNERYAFAAEELRALQERAGSAQEKPYED